MNAARQTTIYHFGEFRIDAAERVLLRGDSPVPIVAKSFDVLLVLVQNKGRLVEKQTLMTTVWADVAVEENSLSRAIADIRKALGESPGENRFVATVPRRGYRFVAAVAEPRGASTETSAAFPAESGRLTTLAVLPFAWLTHEGSDGSLAVGLADALITRLSNLTQIIVRPTSSILRYAGRNRDPIEVAAELKVDFVLSGSLQQADDRVRVTVQMVSPDQQRSIWADHFEEIFTHIFAVEDSISARIAAALALRLTSAQRESLARHSTENHQAYQLYLRGRYCWSRQTFASAQEAIVYFRQAVDLDPQFALAWAGIADAHILIGLTGALTGGMPPDQVYPQARFAALKAIELQSALAEAHASLGFIALFYDWDPQAALEEFGHALALQPNYAIARHGSALAFGFARHPDASLQKMETALAVEPSSPILNANKGYLLYIARRYEKAQAQLRKALEMDPAFPATHYRLGLVLASQGAHAEAIRHLQEAQRLAGDSPYPLGALGHIYARTGLAEQAREILHHLVERSRSQFVSSALMAEVCAGLRDYESALAWLGKAVQERTAAAFTFDVDPRFDELRLQPGFEPSLKC